MKKLRVSLLLALVLPLAGSAAEKLKVKPGPENLDYFKNNHGATLLEWRHPDYPPEPNAEWTQEAVRVVFVVDAEGRVTDARALSGPERFQAAALAALARWKFRPALVDGRLAPVSQEVRFVFRPTGTPPRTARDDFHIPYQVMESETTPPGDPVNTDPLYPKFLVERRLSGEVELVLGINPAGRVEGVEVVRATHPDFLSAALETVAGWEVTPARQGRLPVAGSKQAVLTFFVVDEAVQRSDADWLERNGIFLRTPPATKSADYFEQMPEAVQMVDPVYPHALALAGTRGGARVNFRVNFYGRVVDVEVAEATHPEFGEAVAAAIAAWQFKPLRRNGEECGADFSLTWRFEAPRPDGAEHRLMASLGTDRQPGSARQLDRPLQVLYTRAPHYPAGRGSAGEEGEAEIEVIVDQDGRVRLPQIRSATHPEFGWAAATAVSQWLFETPRKDGKPVDVRVGIPVKFKAPQLESPGSGPGG